MKLAVALLALCGAVAAQPRTTYRVLVSTDLGGDPDDIQSLYRLIHYSDTLRVEGIVSSVGPGAKNSAAKVKEWIKRVDPDYLRRKGHPELMTEKELIGVTAQGAFTSGPPSKDRVTEGSKLIIARAHAADPEGKGRYLWVQAWGSLTDVAQALHDDPTIAKKIRIYSIGSANTRADVASRQYILDGLRDKWPDLWWLESGTYPFRRYDTFKGVHQGGDQSGEWHNEEYVKVNIRGRGSDHNGDYDTISGDAFPLASYGNQHGTILKEGDSPAMLYLLSPVLGGPGNVDDPTQENWGGQYRHLDKAKYPNYYVDLDLPTEETWKTVSKWRVDFLRDWKKRWEWYGSPKPPRLKVSDDRRRLVTDEGVPFVWVGDTAWFLFVNLNREESLRYLEDRKRKKFTVIQAHLLGFDINETNAYGEKAFNDADFTQPNEAYFRHVDSVIARAESLGMYMLLLPVWAKNHIETRQPTLTDPAVAERYGRFLGERYKDRTNIIWCLGGDVRPSKHEIYDALARGLEAGLGYNPLMTYHPPGGTNRPPATSTGEFYHDRPWMDFNMIQSGHRRGNENYLRIAEDYERTPVKPTLDGEPSYEQHPIQHRWEHGAFEAYDLRQRAYWSILSGAFGFTYGANGIWQMAKPDRKGQRTHFNFTWDRALDYEGAGQMAHLHEILWLYPDRVPDASILFTPQGAKDDRIQAARASDGAYWLVYDTSGRGFELKLPAEKGRAWWFNPRNGRRTPAAWTSRFDPPGAAAPGNDWLLILEP